MEPVVRMQAEFPVPKSKPKTQTKQEVEVGQERQLGSEQLTGWQVFTCTWKPGLQRVH